MVKPFIAIEMDSQIDEKIPSALKGPFHCLNKC